MLRLFLISFLLAGCTLPEADPPAIVEDGFEQIFNGQDLTGWTGDLDGYGVEDGILFCRDGSGGNLYFKRTFSDFELRFEFRLTPGANNGVGIRADMNRDAAFYGMEIQIIDVYAEEWAEIKPWQHHGSIYGVVPSRQGFLKPAGEWNRQSIRAVGTVVTVVLNDSTVVDADLSEFRDSPTLDGAEHPGLHNPSGYLGFLGHGDRVDFRRLRVRNLSSSSASETD